MTSTSFYPPSQLQLALALAVIKSKPATTTIRDHILGLRKHIQTGPRERTSATDDKHLDSASFWRQAYEKSEAAHSQLLDRIYELEQRNEALLLGKEQIQPASSPEKSVGKRKSDGKSHISAAPLKRTKTDAPKAATHGAIATINLEEPQDPISALMRQLYALQKLLQKKLNPEALATQCVALCDAAARSISSASKASGQRAIQEPQEVLSRVEPCYTSLLQALKKLSTSSQSPATDTGVVIYHISRLFQTTLLQFHQYSLSLAKGVRPESNNVKSKAKSKTPAKAAVQNGIVTLSEQSEKALSAFSHTLAFMILSLDPLGREQRNLLEGFLFFLLEHVGRILGLFVFRDLRSNRELRVDPTKLPLPDSVDRDSIDNARLREQALAAEFESKYLVWMVDRAVAFISRHNLAAEANAPASVTALPSSRLLELSKSRLQSTLVKGVFGADDPVSKSALRPPAMPSTAEINVSSAPQDMNPGEWFTQELWRLLGWDILSNPETIE